MSKRTGCVWAWLAILPFAAQAQIDLAALDRDMAGSRAKVMVRFRCGSSESDSFLGLSPTGSLGQKQPSSNAHSGVHRARRTSHSDGQSPSSPLTGPRRLGKQAQT